METSLFSKLILIFVSMTLHKKQFSIGFSAQLQCGTWSKIWSSYGGSNSVLTHNCSSETRLRDYTTPTFPELVPRRCDDNIHC